MTNKEKKEYISNILLTYTTPYASEIEKRGKFLKSIPTTLYKYRSFDKHAFEMLDEEYAYLAPVKDLDDPFDCLTNFDFSKYYNEKTRKITPKTIDLLIKIICPNGVLHLNTKQVKELALKCVDQDSFNYEEAPKIVKQSGLMVETQVHPFFVALNNFSENFSNIMDGAKFQSLTKAMMKPDNDVGILSLSEVRDNKVMWSLYGKKYEGYCLEYEVPQIDQTVLYLYPVIYTKRDNNSFIEKMLEYSINALMRGISSGEHSGNISAVMELLCTKDKDWAFQKEWRIIGTGSGHYPYLKLKSVYLGFKANSRNVARVVNIAKQRNFSVYKMNPPKGKKKITYTKII